MKRKMIRRSIYACALSVALAGTLVSPALTAFAAGGAGASNETAAAISGKYSSEGYSLKWNDEFNGTSLNTKDWNIEEHDPGWVNAELQRYVGDNDYRDNIKVSNGVLKILPTAEKKQTGTVSNMLKNSDFSNGMDGWTETIANWGDDYVTDASSTSGNGSIVYDIKNAGTEDWHVQLKQSGLNLKAGVEYRVTFDVVSTVDRSFKTGVMSTTYTWYGGYEPALKANEVYDVDFSFTLDEDDPAADFYISLGKYAVDAETPASLVTIKNLSFVRADGVSDNIADAYDITSGRINTQNKHDFTYGRFESRAKVPTGMGYLPAFWLMATDETLYGQWPQCGEVDIMEVMGQDITKSYHTIHYGYDSGAGHRQNQGTKVLTDSDFANDWHIFRLDWEPGKLTWFVDDEEVYTTSDWFTGKDKESEITYPAPFDSEFYVILNLAVGGSWVGYPDEAVIKDMPNQSFDIDYVRVYQKDAEVYAEAEEKAVRPESGAGAFREPDANGNYVKNWDFAEDIEKTDDASNNWVLHLEKDGEGSEALVSYEGITITQAAEGGVDYSVQLKQEGIPMYRGWNYKLSFDAYADEAREMIVEVEGPDNGWIRYFNDTTVNLTTENKHFEYDFTMNEKTDPNGSVEFNLGARGSTAPVHISNVKIVHADNSEEIVEDTSKSVRADGNYLYNGTFDQGEKRLGYWEISSKDRDYVSVTNEGGIRQLKVVAPQGTSESNPITISQGELAPLSKGPYDFGFIACMEEGGSADAIKAEAAGQAYQPELTTEPKIFSKKINLSKDISRAQSNVKISFTKPGTYYLDNVMLAEAALVKNGSFNSGIAGFAPYIDSSIASSASYIVDNMNGNSNAFVMSIDDTSDTDWKIQLIQDGITLEKGKKYRISFKAKSSIDRQVTYALQCNGNLADPVNEPWENYSKTTDAIDLTKDWKTFSKEFTMEGETDPETRFNITMGAVGGKQITDKHDVYVDDIVLEELGEGKEMYRLFNLGTGEHFYTSSFNEKDNLVKYGWQFEEIGWTAPESSNTPVYRLFNPSVGDHHYTISGREKDACVAAGWIYEGIGWYSDDSKSVPVYREYNPNAATGSHNYTKNKAEHDYLVSAGWLDENIGWYGIQAE